MTKGSRQSGPKRECGIYAEFSKPLPPDGCTEIKVGCRNRECRFSDSQKRGGGVLEVVNNGPDHFHIPDTISRQELSDLFVHTTPPEFCPMDLRQTKPRIRKRKPFIQTQGPISHT